MVADRERTAVFALGKFCTRPKKRKIVSASYDSQTQHVDSVWQIRYVHVLQVIVLQSNELLDLCSI